MTAEPCRHAIASNTDMMRCLAGVIATLFALGAAACADSGAPPGPAGHAYSGPLYLSRSDADHPNAGAAGNVVQCNYWGDGGFNDADVYGDGATADSPDAALDTAYHEGVVDPDGLAVAKRESDRVLYVEEFDDVVKYAVIVHDGPATPGAGGPGWYVESWAACDPADLPRSYTDANGVQIWTDESGRPVPTSKIASWHTDDGCVANDGLDIEKRTYGRPLPGHAKYFEVPYEAHAELPGDAVDTGYQRDGKHLWLAPDQRAAYLGTAADVEVWPALNKGVGCG